MRWFSTGGKSFPIFCLPWRRPECNPCKLIRGSMARTWIFRGCCQLLLLLLLGILSGVQAQSALSVNFTQVPPALSSNSSGSFRFSLIDGNGRDPCSNSSCSILCKLDQEPLQDCSSRGRSYVNLEDGSHVFEVSVNTSNGVQASGRYSWTIDTVPPTAGIFTDQTFTNGFNVIVRIIFTEVCNESGGFSCDDASSCDLMLRGQGEILPSTLQVVRPNLEYRLGISLSNTTLKGRVVLAMARAFCSDAAGNLFQRTDNSTLIVRFDRSAVFVNLWTPIVDSQVLINNQARTIQATNKISDLKLYLDFTEPVVNTTNQLSDSLHPTFGLLQPTRRKSRGNRRFAFLLTNVPENAVVTVAMDTSLVISRYGTSVQAITPVSFIFDQVRPQAAITTTSRAKTKSRFVPILIQFSEPVFQFSASAISVLGGNVSRFKEVSKSTYFAEIFMFDNQVVSVLVPENGTADVAGNTNVASNILRIRHYTVPSVSVALYCFTSAGFLATAVASGALSISSASLAAAGALATPAVGAIVTDPSRNMLGVAGHLQIFALSDWLGVSLPVEYRETIRGIRWLIPHADVPWESHKESDSTADGFILDSTAPSLVKEKWRRILSAVINNWSGADAFLTQRNERKLGSNSSVYGPPLGLSEYQRYFENRTRSSLKDLLKHKDEGWGGFKRNMFWLAVAAGGLIVLHIATLQFLRWRTKTSVRGALTVPRFELFLVLLSLPCISQASSFIIRGGTTGGIVVGVLLLALPAAFLFSVFLFLAVGVLSGTFVQYQQITLMNRKLSWRQKLLASFTGKKTIGRWIRKEGLSSTFLPRYGLLFEDRKGSPKIILLDAEQDVLKWVESGSGGIGRMKALNSDDETEHVQVSKMRKLLGAARTSYILVDIIRRLAIGVLMGAYPRSDRAVSQVVIALVLTAGQLVYLVILKPYIRRGVQVVETVSLACEAGIFAAALALLYRSAASDNSKAVGILMLALLFVSFTAQLANEWYALMGLLLRLPPTQEPSLKLGLKMFGRGLVLPFISRKKWSKFITPQTQQPRTGLAPVVQLSPSPDFQLTRVQAAAGSPIAVAETGVPYDPGSPSLVDPRVSAAAAVQRAGSSLGKDQITGEDRSRWNRWVRSWSSSSEGKRGKPDSKTKELKVLRELAKASFSGTIKKDSGAEIEAEEPEGSPSGGRTRSYSAALIEERGKQKLGEQSSIQQLDDSSDTSSSNGILPVTGSSSKAAAAESQVRKESSSSRRSLEER